MAYNPRDYYYFKAKDNDYAARSVFKLEEIDQRFRVLQRGQKILDLGAAPGSWSQFASQKIGREGRLLGIDLQPIAITLPNAAFSVQDIRKIDWPAILAEFEMQPPFDVVLSDMAPKTTGIRETDQVRSVELCDLALDTACLYLKKGGSFVAKLFHSNEFEAYRERVRARFDRVEVLRPKSTRKESKEIFFIAKGFRG